MGLIKDMWNDRWVGHLMLLGIAIICMLLTLAVRDAIREQHQWEQFAASHHCQVVAHAKGTVQVGTATGIAASGQVGTGLVTTVSPDKTAYRCDDGITYWR